MHFVKSVISVSRKKGKEKAFLLDKDERVVCIFLFNEIRIPKSLRLVDGEVDLGKRYLGLSYKTGMYLLTNRLWRLSNRFSDVCYLLLF